MKKIILMILLVCNLLQANNDEGEKFLQSLVMGYNHGVIKAAQKNKFEHLRNYLTHEIYYKTLVWIESYQDSNLFMDALLVKVTFDKSNTSQYTANVTTDEIWKYRYINIKTKQIVAKPVQVTYKLKYYFVLLEDGNWKINHIKILNEKNELIKDIKEQ